MKQTSILVLGMHRSGTSALTGVLSLLDVYLGSELMKANFANQKGYFENNILYKINEKLLAQIGSSWDDIFYDEEKLDAIKEIGELKSAIKSEFEYAKSFAIKDPRLALLFPVYKKVLDELDINIKIILPYRNPIEVANSLKRRDGMPLEKGMLLWAYHFLLAEKFSRGHERVFVNFDELISDTSKVVEDLSTKLHINFLDKLSKNKKEIEEFLEPSLKHHNISMDNLSDNIPKIVKDILALKDSFNEHNLEKEFDALRYELFSYQKLFYNEGIVSSLDEGKRAKESLKQKSDECLILNDELNRTKESLHVKSEELNQTKQSLHVKTQEAQETKQALHVKGEELNQTKQALHVKTQEAQETKHALHVKSEELSQTEQSLNQKNDECSILNDELQSKEQELSQTKHALHVKSEELNRTKQSLHVKGEELSKLQSELADIYMSKSWRITRPLRQIMRKLRK